MRRPGLRKGEGISGARPGCVQGDAPDDAVVRVEPIRDVGVEGQENVGLGGPDLAHELLAQLEVFDELRIGVAKERDPFHPQYVRCHLLLALANARHLGAGLRRVARAFVA